MTEEEDKDLVTEEVGMVDTPRHVSTVGPKLPDASLYIMKAA